MGDTNVSVSFANFNYEFILFQKRYKVHCQTISKLPKNNIVMIKNNSVKLTNSFIIEYLSFVKSKNVRNKILNKIKFLETKILNDNQYTELININNPTIKEIINVKIKYYKYYISLFEIIGLFGDELSSSFMPNKSDRIKHFKYTHNNSFYEEFTEYKTTVSYKISEFDIKNFDETFLYLLGFYYAYYLFIDSRSRVLIESIINNIINIVLNPKIISLVNENIVSLKKDEIDYLKKIDKIIHKSLLRIFFRCNYSYSLFGVMPKMEENTNIDMTLI